MAFIIAEILAVLIALAISVHVLFRINRKERSCRILTMLVITMVIGLQLILLNENQPTEPRKLATDSYPTENIQFYHGVASGDATDEDLVIWTRATPPFQDEYARDIITNQTMANILKTTYETIAIQWAISTSSDSIDFDCLDSTCGSTYTSASIDYTIKVIVDSLISNTWYYYQFKAGDTTSDIG
eukprot:65128_1